MSDEMPTDEQVKQARKVMTQIMPIAAEMLAEILRRKEGGA